MGSPQPQGRHVAGGILGLHRLMDYVNIQVPQVQITQLPSLHVSNGRPCCWVQPGVKQVASLRRKWVKKLLQRGRCSGSSNELRSTQNNDKILKFPVWFEFFKGKEHWMFNSQGRKWFHGVCCSFLILSSSLVRIHFRKTFKKQLSLHG